MKKPVAILLALVMCVSLIGIGSVAGAFSDVQHDPNARAINALKEAGIIKGDAQGKFNPRGNLSFAEGITGLVKAFDLNIGHIKFIKAPKASDYFTHVKDNAWYAQAFIIAHHHDFGLSKDVQPNKPMTRQEFAHYLFKAIQATGDYSYTEQYIIVTDQEQINMKYSDSIQKLLITNIVSLDKQQKFHPQKTITRSEAFGWIYKAREFVKSMQQPDSNPKPIPNPIPVPTPAPFPDMKIQTKAINPDINEVTVSAQAPHPGYGLRITAIHFVGNEAIIYTEAILPDPDKFYPQVITKVKATTYISSKYKPVFPDQQQVSPGKKHVSPDHPVSNSVQ